MKKLIVFSILFVTYLFATYVSPYGGYITYGNNTDKQNAYFGGLFLSQYSAPYTFEANVEWFSLNYKNSPSYEQTDFTAKTIFYKNYDLSFSVGFHGIFTQDKSNVTRYKTGRVYTTTENNFDYVLLSSVGYKKFFVSLYASNYDSLNLNVLQISPGFVINFWPINFKFIYNHIMLSNDNTTPKKTYDNFDLIFNWNYNHLYYNLKASYDKSAYKVADGGFVVYNLGDEYKYSYKFSVTKYFTSRDSLKFAVGYSVFQEDTNYDAYSLMGMLLYSHSF